jgi:serine/threonine protein phosphatase PrpC
MKTICSWNPNSGSMGRRRDGRHAAGEIASRLAIETLQEVRRRVPLQSSATADDAATWLRDAFSGRTADRHSIRVHEERRGMGTTVVALIQTGDGAVVGHVGTAAFTFARRRSSCATSDHWVNEQVNSVCERRRRAATDAEHRRGARQPKDALVDIASTRWARRRVRPARRPEHDASGRRDQAGGAPAGRPRPPAVLWCKRPICGEDNVTVVVVRFSR